MRRWPQAIELASCLALGALLSIAAGQDASWDIRNYHLYNAASVIDGRIGRDFFAADKHSGLNPLLDFIYISLGRGVLASFPRVLAAVMGLWYGLLVFILLRLAARLFSPFPAAERRILIPLGVLTAASGAMATSQIGTTSNDDAVAALTLAGLLFVLRAGDGGKWRAKPLIAGGFLSGLAGGAKLTAAFYAPGLALALLIALPLAASLRACALLGAGWLAGYLTAFGWWGWIEWRQFGNPFYPMLNGVFKSPLGPPYDLLDARFFPRTAGQWIAYPFYWAWNSHSHTSYERDFRDPRDAFAYLALTALAAVAARDFLRRKPAKPASTEGGLLTLPQKIVVLFTVFGYAAWLETTSILRYAIAIETLAVLAALAIIMRLGMRFRAHIPPFAPLGGAILACCLCAALTAPPDWGHRGFSDKVFDIDMSWTPPDTMFLGIYEPVAYLAAFVPPQAHDQFVGLGFVSYLHGWPLGDRGEEMIKSHHGPFIVLFREEKRPFLKLLADYGLSPEVKNCREIKSSLEPLGESPVLACEAFRI